MVPLFLQLIPTDRLVYGEFRLGQPPGVPFRLSPQKLTNGKFHSLMPVLLQARDPISNRPQPD